VRALTLEELLEIIGMDDDEIALIEDMRRQIDDLELDPKDAGDVVAIRKAESLLAIVNEAKKDA
jgi:hypothetical protein